MEDKVFQNTAQNIKVNLDGGDSVNLVPTSECRSVLMKLVNLGLRNLMKAGPI